MLPKIPILMFGHQNSYSDVLVKVCLMLYNKDRMNEMTWSWLGGFYQAEGCLSGRQLTFPQRDHRSLDLIRDFLSSELPNTKIPSVHKYLSPQNSFKPGSLQHRLDIHFPATPHVLGKLIPYLRSEKRHTIPNGILAVYEQMPLDDEWIVGFWEGDGSIRSANMLCFYQKDKHLLVEIRDYLGLGQISPNVHNPNNYTLHISINMLNVKRIGELLSHVKTVPRLEQLERAMKVE